MATFVIVYDYPALSQDSKLKLFVLEGCVSLRSPSPYYDYES